MTDQARLIDFDAFRSEQDLEPVRLTIGGVTYDLSPTLPASIAVGVIRLQAEVGEDGNVPYTMYDEIGRAVFGESLWQEVLYKHRITIDEVPVLIKQVLGAYTQDPKGQREPDLSDGDVQFSLVENWPWVEADFLREYQIDLLVSLPRMSWRRFSVLVRCLSPNSATVARLSSGQYIGQGRTRGNVVAGKQSAERAFQALFGPDRPERPEEDGS